MNMSSTASPNAPSRRTLSRERILRTALALVDEHGVERLSMRNLGAALGVEAMSLYNHVAGKDAILDGVVETMLAELPEPDASEQDWRVRLAHAARALRELSLAHPKAFTLLARHPARSWLAARGRVEAELERLVASGFSPDDAVRGMRIVLRYALGFCLSDAAAEAAGQRPGRAPADVAAADGFPMVSRLVGTFTRREADELFELGLGLLIEGLDSRLGRR